MGQFCAIEIFSVGPFIILKMAGGWWEEFVRFFFPIAELGELRKWRIENSKVEIRKSGAARRRGFSLGRFQEMEPYEATGLNAIIVKEIS